MPPKPKYTKEQITDAAFGIVRVKGMSALSARSLAKALGSSTAPIFAFFDTIEDVQNAVISKARLLYSEYVRAGLNRTPAFKGVGMKYIQFAKDEPELYKILFMSGSGGEITHYLPQSDSNSALIPETVEKGYGIDKEKAKKLYNHMSVYSYGFAALFAQHINIFTMEDISRMMSEMFTAMIKNGQ